MKVSVLIIAHNEEKYISKCISSILEQTKKVDEVILLLHNSTDDTSKIAGKYPVEIIVFDGEPEIASARIEGLNYVHGDIILCIDGDSYAKNNWVEEMTKILNRNNNILVGSYVKFRGTIFGRLCNIWNKYACASKRSDTTHFIWGPSFAFWGRDKNNVQNYLRYSIKLSKKFELTRNPDDFWLALFMNKKGNIEVTNKTYVFVYEKEASSFKAYKKSKENHKNGYKIVSFLKEK